MQASEAFVQQPFGKIANFVVNSRLRSARNFILNGKKTVAKFETSPSGDTLTIFITKTKS
jgi:hypothetical protein